jgi:hypothetical protein
MVFTREIDGLLENAPQPFAHPNPLQNVQHGLKIFTSAFTTAFRRSLFMISSSLAEPGGREEEGDAPACIPARPVSRHRMPLRGGDTGAD